MNVNQGRCHDSLGLSFIFLASQNFVLQLDICKNSRNLRRSHFSNIKFNLRYFFHLLFHPTHFSSLLRFNNTSEDERIKDLFLISSPWPVFAIVASYLVFVNGKGQQWMKERESFKLNGVINVYNVIQVFLNLYLFVGVSFSIMHRSFDGKVLKEEL